MLDKIAQGGINDSPVAASSSKYLAGEVDETIVSKLRYMNEPKEALEKARQEINQFGKPPVEIANALESSRVLVKQR
jgi:hypothetical protein